MRFLFAVLVFGASAFAQQSADEAAIKNETNGMIRALQSNLYEAKTSCLGDCGGEAASPSCQAAYKGFFNKPEVSISIALGYSDTKTPMPDAGSSFLHSDDSIRRQVWEQKLLRPCPEGVDGTCGFEPVTGDADLYTKTVTTPDGASHVVKLRLSSSASSYYDADNRKAGPAAKPPCKYLAADVAQRTTLQQWAQSCRAATTFYEGLASSDMVVYAGHARLGGGPDFAPPKLIAGTLATNESFYSGRESENRMLSTLSGNPTPPKLMGVFACDADNHFNSQLQTATRGKTGIVSSVGLTDPKVVFAQAYAMVDSVLSMRCEDGFKREMNVIRNENRAPRDVNFAMGPFFKPVSTRAFPEEDPSGSSGRLNTPLLADPAVHPDAGVKPAIKSQGADGVN